MKRDSKRLSLSPLQRYCGNAWKTACVKVAMLRANHRVAWWILVTIALLTYTLFIIYLCRTMTIDSDRANHALQANDILNGNFFLSGWTLTGVSFITTDLLYYIAAQIVCGAMGLREIQVAIGLMVASLMIVSLIAAQYRCRHKVRAIILCFVLVGIPCITYMEALKNHAGAACYSIVAILLFVEAIKANDDWPRNIGATVAMCALLTIGSVGDMLTVVEGAVPIALFSLVMVVNASDARMARQFAILIGIVLLSVVFASVLDWSYYAIGGANKNSYIGSRAFTDIGQWGDRLLDAMGRLLAMGGAGFFGQPMASVRNVPRLASALVLLASLIVMIGAIVRFAVGKKVDEVTVLLSFGSIACCAAFIFTSMAETRYLVFVPASAAIVIARNADEVIGIAKNRNAWCALLAVVMAVSFSGRAYEASTLQAPAKTQTDLNLVKYLEDRGLTGGYASFWNASIYTVLSDDAVRIRHVRFTDDSVVPYKWFCKEEWYNEDARFFVLHDETSVGNINFNLTEDRVVQFFGEPSEVLEYLDFTILVYDYSLSSKVEW